MSKTIPAQSGLDAAQPGYPVCRVPLVDAEDTLKPKTCSDSPQNVTQKESSAMCSHGHSQNCVLTGLSPGNRRCMDAVDRRGRFGDAQLGQSEFSCDIACSRSSHSTAAVMTVFINWCPHNLWALCFHACHKFRILILPEARVKSELASGRRRPG
jgi:hypothetical protein